QPKPYTKPVKGSTRLYQTTQNLMTVQKEIRQAMTPTWVELDLKNCQLAIASKIWDLPELREYLESGQSFWNRILNLLEWEVDRKKPVKTALYSMLYGATPRTIQ